MPRKVAAFMLACALVSSGAQAVELPRVASTSLCGDGYLLALSPEQAVALSWQSRDAVSRANKLQRNLPQVWDDPEQIISSGANHVILGPGEGAVAARFLSKTSISSHALTWGEDFDSVMVNYTETGKLISADRAAALKVVDLNDRLDELNNRIHSRSKSPKILYISRAGGTAGPGTFVDAAITAAGGQNVVKSDGWVTLDPEYIIDLNPDLVITSFMDDGYESVNANGLRHKILQDFLSARPQVNIPGALWPCAGPGLIDAAELIADGLDGLE